MEASAPCIPWTEAEAMELRDSWVRARRVLAGAIAPGCLGIAEGSEIHPPTGLLLLHVRFPGVATVGLCRDHFDANVDIIGALPVGVRD